MAGTIDRGNTASGKGTIDGPGSTYRPAPLAPFQIYGQPTVNPGYASFPNLIPPAALPGVTSPVLPGQAQVGVPIR